MNFQAPGQKNWLILRVQLFTSCKLVACMSFIDYQKKIRPYYHVHTVFHQFRPSVDTVWFGSGACRSGKGGRILLYLLPNGRNIVNTHLLMRSSPFLCLIYILMSILIGTWVSATVASIFSVPPAVNHDKFGVLGPVYS